MDMPEHLRLAGKWADQALSQAQDRVLQDIADRVSAVENDTHSMAATASEMQAQSTEILGHDLATEKQQLSKDIHEACAQLESLNKLVDDIDQNLRQMESAVSKAESAIGMSLSGRLEQLAKFIGSTASGAQGAGSRGAAGVPYLRQWAPKEQAIPQVVNVSEYFDR